MSSVNILQALICTRFFSLYVKLFFQPYLLKCNFTAVRFPPTSHPPPHSLPALSLPIPLCPALPLPSTLCLFLCNYVTNSAPPQQPQAQPAIHHWQHANLRLIFFQSRTHTHVGGCLSLSPQSPLTWDNPLSRWGNNSDYGSVPVTKRLCINSCIIYIYSIQYIYWFGLR